MTLHLELHFTLYLLAVILAYLSPFCTIPMSPKPVSS